MPDDQTQVKFGADIADLKSGMADSQGAVKDALDRMTAALQAMTEQSKQTTDAVVSANKTISDSFASLQSTVQSSFGSISGTLNTFRNVFGAVAGLLAGGALFKSSVDAVINWDTEVSRLSRTLGVTTEKASELAVGLKLVGMGSDQYLGLVQRLERQVKTHSDTLQRLGLVLKDPVSGNTRDLMDVMTQAAEILAKYKDGGDKAQVAMALFGGRVGDVGPLLRMNNDLMEIARKTLQDLGIVVGKDNVQAMNQYRVQLNQFNLSWQAIEMKLGMAVMPLLQSLARWLNTEGPSAVKSFVSWAGELAGTFATVTAEVKKSLAALDMLSKIPDIMSKNREITRTGSDSYPYKKGYISDDYLHGQPGDIGKSPKERIEAAYESAVQKIEEDLKATIAGIKPKAVSPPGASQDSGGAQGGPQGLSAPDWLTDQGGKGSGASTLMAQWQAELEKIKNSQTDLNAWSAENDYQFWNEKLASCKRGSEEWQAVWNKMADLYRQLSAQSQAELEKRAKNEEAISKGTAARVKSDADTAIKLEEGKINTLYELGQISAAQRYSLLKQECDKEYALEMDAYYKELARLQQRGDQTIQQQVKVWTEIEKAHNQYLLKMQKDEDSFLLQLKTKWDGYAAQVGNAVTSMLFHHQSMLQTVQSLSERTFGYIIDTLLKKLVSAWIMGEATKTAATGAGAASRAAAESSGFFASILAKIASQLASWLGFETSKTTATTAGATERKIAETAALASGAMAQSAINVASVTADAFVAAAGAYAATACIPYIGPALAPEAAGTAFEAVAAMIPGASLDVGAWEIPRDMAARLHAGEMVVPKTYAEGMRGAGMAPGAPGGDQHIHISAVDARSFAQAFGRANSDVNRVLKRAHRDFHLSTTTRP
jgi:hypothetical protein